ncbi:MAG: hypothetical protein KL840_04965 [Aquamicrobium sp.]|nr:hypothetical protein [Aquamicrobium sp.]
MTLNFASDHTVNNPRLAEAAMVAYTRDPDGFHDTCGDGHIDEVYVTRPLGARELAVEISLSHA